MEMSNIKNKSLFFIFVALLVIFSSNCLFAANDLAKTKVTLDAEDASISFVLASIAKMSNCNIVLSLESGATGGAGTGTKEQKDEKKITVHLKEVPVEQAIGLVVKSVGLSYKFVGDNTFLVGTAANISEEVGERSYIVNLNNVNAEKMSKAFSILPGKVTPIQGQNAVLINANPESYAQFAKLIETLDVPQKQIEIRARLIEVSINDSKKYGIDWSKLNHLTTILAEDPKNGDGIGLPFNYTDETGTLPFGDKIKYGVMPDEQYFQRMDDWGDVGNFSRQLTAFDITIDWLLQNNAAKVLTDTRITALNGEEAEIFIGEVIPFVVMNNDKQVQVERESAGIKLKVNPSINSSGMITTTINPEVSSITDLVGGYVPRTKLRRITSTVTVPDNSKIIVGGLLSSNIIHTTNKVPFLGDLPLIGKFFQHQIEIISNSDLIIEITPRVIDLNNEKYDIEVDKRLEKELIKKTKQE